MTQNFYPMLWKDGFRSAKMIIAISALASVSCSIPEITGEDPDIILANESSSNGVDTILRTLEESIIPTDDILSANLDVTTLLEVSAESDLLLGNNFDDYEVELYEADDGNDIMDLGIDSTKLSDFMKRHGRIIHELDANNASQPSSTMVTDFNTENMKTVEDWIQAFQSEFGTLGADVNLQESFQLNSTTPNPVTSNAHPRRKSTRCTIKTASSIQRTRKSSRRTTKPDSSMHAENTLSSPYIATTSNIHRVIKDQPVNTAASNIYRILVPSNSSTSAIYDIYNIPVVTQPESITSSSIHEPLEHHQLDSQTTSNIYRVLGLPHPSTTTSSSSVTKKPEETTTERSNKPMGAKEFISKISDYLNILADNFQTYKINEAINAWGEVKKLFVSEPREIMQDIREINYLLSTIRSSWTKNDFDEMYSYIKRHDIVDRGFMINWVNQTIKEDHYTKRDAVEQWKNRMCIAVKFFNANIKERKNMESTVRLGRVIYHMLTIIRSGPFMKKVMENLASNPSMRNEIPWLLNFLTSHHFLFPFFEILKRTTELNGNINNKHMNGLHRIFDKICRETCDSLTRSELLRTRTRNIQEYSVDVILIPEKGQELGILNSEIVTDILMMINKLRDIWILDLERLNGGNMTDDSYLVATSLEILKHILVISSDALLIAFGMNKHTGYSQPVSSRFIFEYLTIANFDVEKVKQLIN